MRFYDFFGLSLSEGQREEPDHLLTELEFLHYLAYQEAGLRLPRGSGNGSKSIQSRSGQYLLGRHPKAPLPGRGRVIAGLQSVDQ